MKIKSCLAFAVLVLFCLGVNGALADDCTSSLCQPMDQMKGALDCISGETSGAQCSNDQVAIFRDGCTNGHRLMLEKVAGNPQAITNVNKFFDMLSKAVDEVDRAIKSGNQLALAAAIQKVKKIRKAAHEEFKED